MTNTPARVVADAVADGSDRAVDFFDFDENRSDAGGSVGIPVRASEAQGSEGAWPVVASGRARERVCVQPERDVGSEPAV
jgi:hypothetical protein